ncbi:MAG: hypothetical protein ACYC8T_30160 [Myxococcaceae bacterium]
MKTLTSSALFLFVGLLSACGPPESANPCSADGGICDLATCQPGQSVVGTAEAPGANCTFGGVKYTSASGVNYICSGALGPTGISGAAGSVGMTGPAGDTGAAGQSVGGASEAAGANCVYGGIKYTSVTGVHYVCNAAPGATGAAGATGSIGATGLTGAAGAVGAIGAAGAAGQSVVGASEAIGTNCARGGVKYTLGTLISYICNGAVGPAGTTGATGAVGATGPMGPAGGNMAFGYFYALMGGGSTDNSAPVATDVAVEFPRMGAASGIALKTASKSEIVLPAIGFYDVSWQVSVDEPGQLALWLNTALQPSTVAGRAAPTSQIGNHVVIETTVVNSVITIRNAGSPAALTVTPVAGGTSTVSASIVIKQVL